MEDYKKISYRDFIKLSEEVGLDSAYKQFSNKNLSLDGYKEHHLEGFLIYWKEKFGEDDELDVDYVFNESYPYIFGEKYDNDHNAAVRWLGEKIYYRLYDDGNVDAADLTDEIEKSMNGSDNIVDSMINDRRSIYRNGILMVNCNK